MAGLEEPETEHVRKVARTKKPLPKRIAGKLLRLLASRPQGRPKLKPGDPGRILLIRYDRLGDMIITTPLIEILHNIAPQAEIDVLASWRNASLIEHDPRIHQVLRWDGSPFKRIRTLLDCRKRRYDLTLQLILWRTTLPGLLAGRLTPHGRVVSRDDPNNRDLFDHTYKVNSTTHYAEQVYGFLGAAFDFDDEVPSMPAYSIHTPEKIQKRASKRLIDAGLSPEGYIMINLSAGEKRRELTNEQNIVLVQELLKIAEERSLKIVFTGGPNEYARAESLVKRLHSERLHLFFSSLPEVAVAISKARLVITPDTGTNHLASALGRPTVVFFLGDGRPVGWGPRGVPHRIVQASFGNDTSSIEIEELINATKALLEEVGIS
ncbi:MAG: glycosyltransferase family 9 protein [Chlorobi bacterium]|nr:glycosyltransferase family 9 protein [Chlorobiota bacterium]